MKALVLATGETEKLRPLTERLPSPLVTILNRPVIAYVIEQAVRGGIK
jgi:NDP-sugar pyrophosphorylase family protein